jgi:hypothetical protein
VNRVAGILIGVVSGVISSIGAALVEAVFMTTRFVTLGKSGPSIGSGLLVVMVTGAIVGALTGVVLGNLLSRKKTSSS